MISGRLHPPPFSLIAFVDRAFVVLDAELPEMHERLTKALDGARVALRIESEEMTVSFQQARQDQPSRITVEPGWNEPLDARVETDTATILGVIGGHETLPEAVDREGVRATADLDVLQALLEGLQIFVHGGVRCPTFPPLLESFRSFASWRHAGS